MDGDTLLRAIDDCAPGIVATYRSLHAMPEGPFEEHRTSAYIAERLRSAGFDVQSGVAGTGVVASLGRLSHSVLALRADMDALAHEIEKGRPAFAHSCGHDANSAMVLCAGEVLARVRPQACGHLKLVFQPAEEVGLGAQRMCAAGVLDDVSMMLGIHLRPRHECGFGMATPCLRHAASTTLRFTVAGKSAHAARPHLGVNAADAIALGVSSINAIKPNPVTRSTVNVVGLSAGCGPANVIPEKGQLTVNIRTDTDEATAAMERKVRAAVWQAAACVGATIEAVETESMPPATYDAEAVRLARDAIVCVLGERGVVEGIDTPGSEDFHHYRRHKPALKAAYIGLGADLSPGLHDPTSSFNLDALVVGVKILATAAVLFAERRLGAT